MNRALLSLLLALSTLLGVSACTEAEKEQMEYKATERKRAAAEKAVRERAQLYWELVRWKDWERGSRFFESPESQLSFVRQVSGASSGVTREDIEVQFVFVSAEDLERATLRIGWNEVTPASGTVRPVLVEQRWYKAQGMWWTHADQPFGKPTGEVGAMGTDPEGINEEPPNDLPSTPAESAEEDRNND